MNTCRNRKLGLTLNNSDQRSVMPLANNQVYLPVTNSAFFINNVRTLINTDAVFNLSTSCLLLAPWVIGFALAA